MSPNTDRELRVSKIEQGTVIDHIAAGQALNVLALLRIDGSSGETVSVALSVPSERLGRKDVVKVEGRDLNQDEVDVLSLIAPEATINIIQDYTVIEKRRVEPPDRVEGVLDCPNRECITNTGEPIASTFAVLEEGLRCKYCEAIIADDIAEHLAT